MSDLQARPSEFDFILVFDKSGSMGDPSKAGSLVSRWDYVQESAIAITREVVKVDQDGVGIVLFGGKTATSFDNCTVDKVREIFAGNSPMGTTPLTEGLQAAFALAGKSDKKDFIIVFTDGVPNDKATAAEAIIDHANKQETDDACTVLFIQVGDDAAASAFLQKLDDDLTGAKFDIVDAKTIDQVEDFPSVLALIEAAIND